MEEDGDKVEKGKRGDETSKKGKKCKGKCKCETKCTYNIHDMIHEIAKIHRKEYPKLTNYQVLQKTHTHIWKSQGGRTSNEDGGFEYWEKMVNEYYEKMQRGEYVLRKQKKMKARGKERGREAV